VPVLQARGAHRQARSRRSTATKVKIVWRHKPLPLHQNAPLAAEAARESLQAQKGNAGFWKFHGKLFEKPLARRTA
jgi:hypothetical protein